MRNHPRKRLLALFVLFTAVFPQSVFSLRDIQTVDSGLEERELVASLTAAPLPSTAVSAPTAGLEEYVVEFKHPTARDLQEVGGKIASLAELSVIKGIHVPEGLAVKVPAYNLFVEKGRISPLIAQLNAVSDEWIQLERLKEQEGSSLLEIDALQKPLEKKIANQALQIRQAMQKTPIPGPVAREIRRKYKKLSGDRKNFAVAVRSSATAEDLPQASFAGQQDTFLNQRGAYAVVEAVRKSWSSLFGDRAVFYRNQQAARGNPDAAALLRHDRVKIAVGIQRMIPAAAAGVAFTVDPVTGNPAIVITANYGLGESVVSGRVTPDRWAFTPDEPLKLMGWRLGEKEERIVSVARGTEIRKTTAEKQRRFSLSDDVVLRIARAVSKIGAHYRELHNYPYMDIEFAVDERRKIYFLQARPETVQSRQQGPRSDLRAILPEEAAKGKQLARGGITGSDGVSSGRVRVLKDVSEISSLEPGDILVTHFTTPDWQGAFHRIAAVITEIGGDMAHAAISSREIGIPALVAVENAVEKLSPYEGQSVTVDANSQVVYEGILPTVPATDVVLRSRPPFVMEVRPLERSEKVGRPGYPLSLLQHELYLAGFHQFARDFFGKTLNADIRTKPEGYELWADPQEHTEMTRSIQDWDLDHLEGVLERRRRANERFHRVSASFRGTRAQFDEWVEATVEAITHYNLRFALLWRVTQIGQRWIKDHPEKESAASEYRSWLERTVRSELLEEKTAEYHALLLKARPWRDLFQPQDAEIVLDQLKRKKGAQDLLKQLYGYAEDYEPTEKDDIREPVPIARVINQLRTDLKEYQLRRRNPVSEPEPWVDLTDKEKRLPGLYHTLPLMRDEEHVLYQRSLRRVRNELFRLGEQWVSQGILSKPEEVLDLGINPLRDLLGSAAGLEEEFEKWIPGWLKGLATAEELGQWITRGHEALLGTQPVAVLFDPGLVPGKGDEERKRLLLELQEQMRSVFALPEETRFRLGLYSARAEWEEEFRIIEVVRHPEGKEGSLPMSAFPLVVTEALASLQGRLYVDPLFYAGLEELTLPQVLSTLTELFA